MLKNISYAKKLFSTTLVISTIFASFLWINGCQKKQIVQEQLSEEQKIDLVRKKIAKQSTASFVIQDGSVLGSYYTDKVGNKISSAILKTGPGCYTDDPTATAEGIQFQQDCGATDFYGIVSFKISAYNAVVATNPANPTSTAVSDKTRGRLQILNSSGTQLYNQANIWGNLVITDLGVDPDFTDRTLYRVTFQATNIPASVINTGNWQAKVYITFYSECEEDTNPYPYNVISAYGNPSGLTACNIINKVWVDPSLHYVSGSNACLCFCGPTLYSNRQEVEIYNASGSTKLWAATDDPGKPSGWSGLLTPTSVVHVPETYVSSGQTVKIRYRNVQINTSTGAVECRSSWLSKYETWVW